MGLVGIKEEKTPPLPKLTYPSRRVVLNFSRNLARDRTRTATRAKSAFLAPNSITGDGSSLARAEIDRR